jgi:hypothetical protein
VNAAARLRWGSLQLGAALLLVAGSARAQDPPANPEPMRHALLIGVNDYQPSNYDNSDRKRKRLRNLSTPCEDVERVGARLEALGWQGATDPQPEIEVLCDPTDDAMDARIEDLIEQYDDPRKFLFVYLAGHGAQIGARTYIFGKQAELDLDMAERRLTQSSSNILFQGQSIELVADLFARANYAEYQGNVLLVLDSCRDDPLYSSIKTGASTLTAPVIDTDSAGIIVLYATTPGRRVSDGSGTSFLADSLVRLIDSGLTVDRIVGNVMRDVRDKSKLTLNPQKPERTGALTESSWCFAGCTAPVVAASPPPSGLAWQPRVRRRAGAAFDQEPPAAATVPAKSAVPRPERFESLFQQTAMTQQQAQAEPLVMDVYWCDDGGGGAAHRERAEAFVKELQGAGTGRTTGGAFLTDVRLRALSAEDNARVQYGIDRDLVRYDADSASEQAWAKRLAGLAGEPLALRGDRSNTPGKMSLFFCAGMDVPARAGKLWVQVARPAQRGIGLVLADQVRRGVETLWVESEIEVVESSPDESQVRYFHAEDAALAERIADSAGQRLAVRPVVKHLPMYATRVEPGKLELWLGRNVDFEGLVDAAE